MVDQVHELLTESILEDKNCNLCNEVKLNVGDKTEYGAAIIYKVGSSVNNGWFATLSPKVGSDPEKDFSIQLMPFAHLTHFSQLSMYPELAKNYGVAFSKISNAITKTMALEIPGFNANSDSRDHAVSIGTYGKSTTWKDKKEHLHIKLFPFRGNIGQPYTVDSSFGRKQIFKENDSEEGFIKMTPVKKVNLRKERFDYLSNLFQSLLKD